MTLHDAMSEWLDEVALKGTKTVELYMSTRNLVDLFFGKGQDLDKVTAAQVTTWVNWLRTVRGNSNNTIRGRLKHLGIFFSWAIQRGYVASNPAREVLMPAQEKKEVQAVPHDWMKQVLEFIMDQYKASGKVSWLRDLAMIGLLYGTGIRRGGLLSANWKNFDAKVGTLTVVEKGLKTRTVALPEKLVNVLVELKKVSKAGPIFDMTGDGVRKHLRRLFQMADLPLDMYRISPHTLRHSFAVHELLAGNDLKTVSQALGHTRIATTAQFYTNLTDSQVWAKTKAHNPLNGILQVS